jgi:glucose/arabinose dehydrogenase
LCWRHAAPPQADSDQPGTPRTFATFDYHPAAGVALDSTRATIQRFNLLSHVATDEAYNIRNAIAIAVNPQTRTLWAGVAGADDLPLYHPYEIFDAVSLHDDPVDYSWPACYENRKHFEKWSGDCSKTPIPRVVFPAYETPIEGLTGYVPPRVVFVPMRGDDPDHPVNWNDPTTRWQPFIGGYQIGGTAQRIGRPTGIAVGPDGSLFRSAGP